MLVKLVNACHTRYSVSKCFSCSYQDNCPHDCAKCLHYIHSPKQAPAPRKYDCGRMTDYYVCKYAYKYTSEIYYALNRCKFLRKKKDIKVLSIGCGPCTDLLALDLLKKNGEYIFESLDYKGIEIDTSIWQSVHQDMSDLVPEEYHVEIIEADACLYIQQLCSIDWRPDIIIFQYVFSDMRKHSGDVAIRSMITALKSYIETCHGETYIICNDINLDVTRSGGRDYFDILLAGLQRIVQSYKCHFNNSNRERHYHYGEEYSNNSLILPNPPYLAKYEPFTSCSSAQLLMMRVKE